MKNCALDLEVVDHPFPDDDEDDDGHDDDDEEEDGDECPAIVKIAIAHTLSSTSVVVALLKLNKVKEEKQ